MGEVAEAVAVPTLDHPNKSDVQRLADALGLGFDSVRSLPSAKRMDVAEALAMNRALWPATLGAYARNFIASLLPEARARLARALRADLRHRTRAATLDPHRRQPYGVLVTSALPRFAVERGASAVATLPSSALSTPPMHGSPPIGARSRPRSRGSARAIAALPRS